MRLAGLDQSLRQPQTINKTRAAEIEVQRARTGWYAQAIYQPFPRWRFGLRFDSLSSATPDATFAGTGLYPSGSKPKRYSLMVDWSKSEFSRLRFQYNRDQAGIADDNQFGLQYIFSIGAHSAHSF